MKKIDQSKDEFAVITEALKVSFLDLGLSEAEAETAARGRNFSSDESDSEKSLLESFKGLGLPQNIAEIAARGRDPVVSETDPQAILVESFKKLGLSDSLATRAAKGRDGYLAIVEANNQSQANIPGKYYVTNQIGNDAGRSFEDTCSLLSLKLSDVMAKVDEYKRTLPRDTAVSRMSTWLHTAGFRTDSANQACDELFGKDEFPAELARAAAAKKTAVGESTSAKSLNGQSHLVQLEEGAGEGRLVQIREFTEQNWGRGK